MCFCVLDIQAAVKCTTGILYFQTLVPLHVLFVEGGLMEQQEWLKQWREDIPGSNESINNFTLSRAFVDVQTIRNKLNLNNVFTVAQRMVNGDVSDICI